MCSPKMQLSISKVSAITTYTIVIILILVQNSECQFNPNGCSSYLRSTHRMGPNVVGRLEIPTDDFYPKYKLKIGFSSPIHHMTIRQSRAKDMGNHRDFIVDPMEMRKDGKLNLDMFIRLSRLFGAAPRVTRIVYNNVVLCGEALDVSEIEDAFQLETGTTLALPPTPPPAASNSSTTPISSLWKTKYFGEDEEIFHDAGEK